MPDYSQRFVTADPASQVPYLDLYSSSAGAPSMPVSVLLDYVHRIPAAHLKLLHPDSAFVQAAFRNRHPGMHGIQDMAYLVGGKWYKEFVGAMYMIGLV